MIGIGINLPKNRLLGKPQNLNQSIYPLFHCCLVAKNSVKEGYISVREGYRKDKGAPQKCKGGLRECKVTGYTPTSPKVYGKVTEMAGWNTGDTAVNVSTGTIVITATLF
jgi:hypothetical protein